MDSHELDRKIARARDPRLIPGIYNYCDGRCRRRAFTERCLVFRESGAEDAHRVDPPPADDTDPSLE